MKVTKGHWPKGKTRSDMTGRQLSRWPTVRRQLELVLDRREYGDHPMRASMRGLAEYLGVHNRSVRRWVRGELYPMSEYYCEIVAWLRKH